MIGPVRWAPKPGRSRIWRPYLFALCLAYACSARVSAQTISPNDVFGDYRQFVWQEQHGVPQNTIPAVAATRDGYLWLGTQEGLARFDGVRFTPFTTANTPALGNPLVGVLLEDRAGSLWIGTYGGGLTRLTDGRFTRYTTADGLPGDFVTCLFEDAEGTLWVGTDGSGIAAWRDGRFTRYTAENGLPSNVVRSFADAGDGGTWIGTGAGIAHMKAGRISTAPAHAALRNVAIYVLLRAPDEALWAGTLEGGLYRFAGDTMTRFGREHGLVDDAINSLHFDRSGYLWVGSIDAGLFRFSNGRFEHYAHADGLPAARVAAIADGVDGTVWLGTDGGLVQLKPQRFTTYSSSDGLASDSVGDIYQDPDGAIWIGTNRGVSRFMDGTFTTFTVKDGLADDRVQTITGNTAGAPLVHTRHGFAQWANGRFTSQPAIAGIPSERVNAILSDRSGTRWLALEDAGVARVRDQQITRFTVQNGLADNAVLSLFEDRQGRIWVATMRGGMSCIDGERVTSWSTRDGLANDHVKAFYEDAGGVIWIATHGGGLSRLEHGSLSTIASKDGLYTDVIFHIVEDGHGNFWMNSNRGIWRASLAELNAYANGQRSTVSSFGYGRSDGMRSGEGVGAPHSAARMRDGTIWFATVAGVVVADPRQSDPRPARVVIEGATVDRTPVNAREPLRILPGQEDLEIEYTGLSWNRPHEIKFRYQLRGLDREWRDAGPRRTAYYSHIPPGTYTFTVVADNGEGVWTPAGESLAVVVLPPIYRTWWFRTLVLLAIAAAIVAAWNYRVSRLKHAHLRQQAFSRQLLASQEQERQRIAAELHDGLGQRLVVIKTLTALGLESPHDTAASLARLEAVSSEASAAIDEVRGISYNLRPYQLDSLGLTKAIDALVKSSTSASGIPFVVDICDLDSAFPADQEINVYRIVQECLANIVKHSRARHARIEMRRERGVLAVTVSDDGVGMPAVVAGSEPRGGFGLRGLQERVQLLGGTMAIRSAAGQGTTIDINIPLQERGHDG